MTHARVAPPRLARLARPERAWRRLARRALWLVIGVQAVLALVSGYRAIVQVYGVRVDAGAGPLGPRARVGAAVVTSGRTTVTLRLELVQGGRAHVLAVHEVRGNRDGALDPRPRRARADVALTPAMLASLDAGPAMVRATATGRSQWLRVPPPTMDSAAVVLRPR